MKRLPIKSVAAVVLSGVVAFVGMIPAVAQESRAPITPLQLVTPYPAVSLDPGKSASFNIEVRTDRRKRVDLAVIEAPPGWNAQLKGGGFVVNGVFGSPDVPPSVTLEARVPADAAHGPYRILVRAISTGLTDILEFTINVANVGGGAVSLTAEFQTLRQASDQEFNYTLTLKNDSPEATTFTLAGEGPAPNWVVSLAPSTQEQASTVKVDPGATQNLTLKANPPDDVTAGRYDIKARAEAPGKSSEVTVVAEVTGSLNLNLTTPDGRLNGEGVAGRTRELTLVVRNSGTTGVRNVRVTGTAPSGWRVTVRPTTVREVGAKKSTNVTARITPSSDAVAGDYLLNFSASAEGASDEAEVRYNVKTSRIWGLIGLAVIAAAVWFMMSFYRRLGRR